MSYSKRNYADVDTRAGMHFLRDSLDCERLGVTVVDCEPGWSSPEHDHAEDGQEEVYVLVEGEATVTIDGEEVPMSAGDAVRVPSEATRQIRNGDGPSRFVLAGAT